MQRVRQRKTNDNRKEESRMVVFKFREFPILLFVHMSRARAYIVSSLLIFFRSAEQQSGVKENKNWN